MTEATEPKDRQTEQNTARPDQRLDEAGRPITAIVLMSGGLDSWLAAHLMLDQGIKVIALNYLTCFCTCTSKNACGSEASRACKELGIPLKVINNNKAFIEIIKNPPHGYGKHMNPCIDCRIQMFRTAREYMEEVGAHFLVTGEVLGQRLMSQRRNAMDLIDREAGIRGICLRPLSAQHFAPTVPEEKGWVNRETLLAIQGRSRKPQIELAEKYDMKDYPCAAGGCLLTYEGFARKVRDLVKRKPAADVRDFQLLTVGRHFRLPGGGKAIVGRDEHENERLCNMARDGDRIYDRSDTVGPVVVLCDSNQQEDERLAAALCVSHSKLVGGPCGTVEYYTKGDEAHTQTIEIEPLDRSDVDTLRL